MRIRKIYAQITKLITSYEDMLERVEAAFGDGKYRPQAGDVRDRLKDAKHHAGRMHDNIIQANRDLKALAGTAKEKRTS